MDYRRLFANDAVRREFLDRFEELVLQAGLRGGGFERLDGRLTVDRAAEAVERMTTGAWVPDGTPLEAIVRRFTRPVHLVQQSTFALDPDDFSHSSEVGHRLTVARPLLERVVPSVGRIDVRNHELDWIGTGWMVRPRIVVTNRHVAEEFARAEAGLFVFRRAVDGRTVQALIDWCHEYRQPEESHFHIESVLWIEPETSVDLALLRISAEGRAGEAPPPIIELMTPEELGRAGVGAWVAVIGYPEFDIRNDTADQQRIFGGVYGVKRLAPGQVTALASDGLLHHDATTLGGNSGSVVIDLDTGKAAALHFGGFPGERNLAVQAPIVEQILRERVG